MEEATLRLKDLKGLIRRRRNIFILTFSSVFLIICAVAFLLPPIYRSEAKIRIEGQQIPQDFVRSTITTYVEERLQQITQQVLSRGRLMVIIGQFDLYPDLKDRFTTEDIINKMRGDIELKTISADIGDREKSREYAATVAFTLSYQGKDPSKVQKVTNALVGLYLEEHSRARERLASTTTDFFRKEEQELKGEIEILENRISEFKKDHIGELPEYNAINLQAVARLERELDQAEMQVRSLQERKMYLEGQLQMVEPLTAGAEDPAQRLKDLRLQLISLQSTLSEKHPDIKKLKREISELEVRVESSDNYLAKARRLNELETQLTALKAKFGPRHPDVERLSREVTALSEEVAELQAKQAPGQRPAVESDNPAYINLVTQIASTEMEIKSLLQEQSKIKASIQDYQRKIEKAPLVEKEYNSLLRDYEGVKKRYDEIMGKLSEATVAQEMEETRRGERFSLIEPPQLPEKPFKPNRIAIFLIGFVLAMGAGTGLAATREYLDESVKTADEISSLTGVPVFSVIPLLETTEEKRARRTKRVAWGLAAVAVVATSIWAADYFVMPMGVFWEKIHRKLMIMGFPV